MDRIAEIPFFRIGLTHELLAPDIWLRSDEIVSP